MKRWMMLVTAIPLAIASCGGGDSGGSSVTVRIERPAFDADRAFHDLERQVAFGPRIPGSTGHAQQLEWLETELRALADTVLLDPFEHLTAEGHKLDLTNVIARFGPADGSRLLLLTHWDTRPKADQSFEAADREEPVPGANDGASGTAILLELARMFNEQPPPGGVELLFTDGEDYGPSTDDMFLGARHYVAGIGSENPPAFGILLDMVADADPSFPVEAYSMEGAGQVVQRVWGIAADLGYRRFFSHGSDREGDRRSRSIQQRGDSGGGSHRLRLRSGERLLAHAPGRSGEHECPDPSHGRRRRGGGGVPEPVNRIGPGALEIFRCRDHDRTSCLSPPPLQ